METPVPEDDHATKSFVESVKKNNLGTFLTSGLQLAISVVVFFFIGYWLDGKLGTSPWCTIGGAVLGIAGGMIKFLRDAIALGKEADKDLKEIEQHHRES